MKIGFPSPPPIGLTISLDGQRFDLVAVEPHTKLDGAVVDLLVWSAECPECGEGFAGRSPVTSLPQVRRCPLHRRPGKRVRPAEPMETYLGGNL